MPWNDNPSPGPWGSAGGAPKGEGGKGEGDKSGDRGPDQGGSGQGQVQGQGPGPASGGGAGGGGRRPNPWGAGPKGEGPRGEGPRGDVPRPRPNPDRGPGGPRPQLKGPHLDDLLGQLKDGFNARFGGPGGAPRGGLVAGFVGIAFAAWALSGFYVVQPDQEAVVTRFGGYARSEGPGLRYHIPNPIEHVEKVSVTSLNRLDVGGTAGADVPAESLMLTGDENIVDLNFSVQWRISDAARYLFSVADPEAAVKMTAESAMREVVGKTPLQSILTTGRGQVQAQAAELMQKTLDAWGAGVTVVEVQIRTANPPQEVIGAFREVANAGQDAEAAVNEANTYRNRVINEAKGDAARIVQAAQAYREQVVREAQGEADRFAAIDAEYKRAPEVTRQRLYTETMERILRNSNKVFLDTPKGGTAPIVLPPDLLRDRRTPPAAPPQPQAQPQQPAAQPAQSGQGQTQTQAQGGAQ